LESVDKKVTTFDISNELGISRNTVSKALNNHPSISYETKKKVLHQAIQMGYKKAVLKEEERRSVRRETKSITLLTMRDLRKEGFWMSVMSGVEAVLSDNGFDMKLAFVKYEDIESLTVPPLLGGVIDGFIVAGIMEVPYTEALMRIPLPKVFIDLHADLPLSEAKTDVILMESAEGVYTITRHLIDSGHREIGFIGDITSRSFRERWMGFLRAMNESTLPLRPEYCITHDQPSFYQYYDNVSRALGSLETLPTALVCANDVTALHAVKFAKDRGLSVPGDLSVSGFDHFNESGLLDVSLTTVAYDEFQLGLRAAEEVLFRLRRPDRPYSVIRLATNVLFGDSTSAPRP
jgi:LacI family transcriptional regulator